MQPPRKRQSQTAEQDPETQGGQGPGLPASRGHSGVEAFHREQETCVGALRSAASFLMAAHTVPGTHTWVAFGAPATLSANPGPRQPRWSQDSGSASPRTGQVTAHCHVPTPDASALRDLPRDRQP